MGDPLVRVVSVGSTYSGALSEKRTVNIQVVFCKHLGTLVDGIARPIEYPSKHIFCDREFHAAPGEFDMCRLDVHARCAFEYLDNGLLTLDFKNLATTFRAVGEGELNDFVIRGKLPRLPSGHSHTLKIGTTP
jgi:hypothetical protein